MHMNFNTKKPEEQELKICTLRIFPQAVKDLAEEVCNSTVGRGLSASDLKRPLVAILGKPEGGTWLVALFEELLKFTERVIAKRLRELRTGS